MTTPNFPLISVSPVADVKHNWIALTLFLEPAAAVYDTAALSRLFGEFGLLDALGELSCLLETPDAARLGDDLADQIPADQVVLCLPVELCADAANQEKLNQLHAQGFRILAQGLPPQNAQLAHVQGIAIDCGAGTPSAAAPWLKQLGGPHLAESVKTPAFLDQCAAAGFGWFSGECLLHFVAPDKKGSSQSRTLLLKLLSLVTRDAETRELEALLKQDAGLTFQLFKLVNSVAFSRSNKIESFGQAIALLGRRQLQRWLQLLLYAQQQGSGASNPLLPLAALRASLMEAISLKSGGSKEEQDQAFMVGMFSLLEKLFGTPLASIIKELNLSEAMKGALLERKGRLGALLVLAEQAARTTGQLQPQALAACGVGTEDYCQALMKACEWAIQVSREN